MGSVGTMKRQGLKLNSLLHFLIVVLLALTLVYAALFFGSQIGLSFFVLSHRAMVQYNVSGGLVSAGLDDLIWGAAIFSSALLMSFAILKRTGKTVGSILGIAVFAMVALARHNLNEPNDL